MPFPLQTLKSIQHGGSVKTKESKKRGGFSDICVSHTVYEFKSVNWLFGRCPSLTLLGRRILWWCDCIWLAGRRYDSDEEYDDRGKRRRRHSDSDSDSQAEGEEAPLCGHTSVECINDKIGVLKIRNRLKHCIGSFSV